MINYRVAGTVFISQASGSDRNSGLYRENMDGGHGPVKSLEKALKIVKKMRRDGYLQPVQVEILDEEYVISKTVEITPGMDHIHIVGNGKTVVHGGRKITGFQPDVFNGKACFSAEVPQVRDGFWFTDFYVNGKRADVTAIPREGFFTPLKVENNEQRYDAESNWFEARPEDMEVFNKLPNIEDCQLTYYHYWVDAHTPIKHYDPQTGRFDMALRSRFAINAYVHGAIMRYKLENVAVAFENPNEWYLDRNTAKVYYIPETENQTPESVVAYAPVVDKLFVVRGSQRRPVEGIRFSGLTFAYSKAEHASRFATNSLGPLPESDPGLACDEQSCDTAYGAVEFFYARRCAVERCRFTMIGIHGLTVNAGCSGIRIYGNRLEHLGGGGIKIDGVRYGGAPFDETHDILVAQNRIFNCGLRFAASCGVLIKHAYGNTVSHNDIGYLFYTGISVGWEWGYQENMCRDNLIEYNHVHHIGQGKLSDMGAIYLLGKQPGTIVRNNIVHDVQGFRYGGTGIYTDEGSSYITIENNILYNIHSSGFNEHFGKENALRNNISCKAGEPIRHSRPENHAGYISERNIFVSDGTPFCGYGMPGEATDNFQMIQGNHNLFYDLQGDLCFHNTYGITHTLEQAQEELGLEQHSVYADPQFVDFENNDFRLLPDSPAIKLGFREIDISEVGVTIELDEGETL